MLFWGSGKGWLGGARARGGGSKGFGSEGGVGGRGTGPRDGANFAILTRTKRRKMAFFEGCSVVWGVPTGAGLTKEGAWLAVPKKGKSIGLLGSSTGGGKGSGGNPRASVPEG